MTHSLTIADFAVRLGLALALGALVGLEREYGDQPAGLRTHLLVTFGATLFASAGLVVGRNTDLTRVGAQVATGIGFLGAGVILQQGGHIRGLTTAASLWSTAAVGVAIGFGYFAAAAMFTGAILVVLTGLKTLEHSVFPRLRGKPLVVVTAPGTTAHQALAAIRAVVDPLQVGQVLARSDGSLQLELTVASRRTQRPVELTDALLGLPEVAGVEVRA